MFEAGKFRHNALRRMSSPEQLDQMLRVTLARRWLGLAGLLLLIAVTVAWSAVATVPTTLKGPGYLLPQGGLREVQAAASGVVSVLTASTGEHVVAQEQVGTIVDANGKRVPVLAPETGVLTEADTVAHAYVNAGQRRSPAPIPSGSRRSHPSAPRCARMRARSMTARPSSSRVTASAGRPTSLL